MENLEKKSLGFKGILAISAIYTITSLTPTAHAGWITGSATYRNETECMPSKPQPMNPQKREFYRKMGNKALDKLNPYSDLIDITEKFSKAYNKYKKKKKNIGTGTGVTRNKNWW